MCPFEVTEAPITLRWTHTRIVSSIVTLTLNFVPLNNTSVHVYKLESFFIHVIWFYNITCWSYAQHKVSTQTSGHGQINMHYHFCGAKMMSRTVIVAEKTDMSNELYTLTKSDRYLFYNENIVLRLFYSNREMKSNMLFKECCLSK